MYEANATVRVAPSIAANIAGYAASPFSNGSTEHPGSSGRCVTVPTSLAIGATAGAILAGNRGSAVPADREVKNRPDKGGHPPEPRPPDRRPHVVLGQDDVRRDAKGDGDVRHN